MYFIYPSENIQYTSLLNSFICHFRKHQHRHRHHHPPQIPFSKILFTQGSNMQHNSKNSYNNGNRDERPPYKDSFYPDGNRSSHYTKNGGGSGSGAPHHHSRLHFDKTRHINVSVSEARELATRPSSSKPKGFRNISFLQQDIEPLAAPPPPPVENIAICDNCIKPRSTHGICKTICVDFVNHYLDLNGDSEQRGCPKGLSCHFRHEPDFYCRVVKLRRQSSSGFPKIGVIVGFRFDRRGKLEFEVEFRNPLPRDDTRVSLLFCRNPLEEKIVKERFNQYNKLPDPSPSASTTTTATTTASHSTGKRDRSGSPVKETSDAAKPTPLTNSESTDKKDSVTDHSDHSDNDEEEEERRSKKRSRSRSADNRDPSRSPTAKRKRAPSKSRSRSRSRSKSPEKSNVTNANSNIVKTDSVESNVTALQKSTQSNLGEFALTFATTKKWIYQVKPRDIELYMMREEDYDNHPVIKNFRFD